MKKVITLLALAFCLNGKAQCTLTVTATTTSVTCNGLNNGSATVTASGGTGGYTYTWSPIGGNTSIANNLSVGVYTCNVKDGSGCVGTTAIVIAQPPVLTLTAATTSVTCNGLSNGSATVMVTGGTGTTYTVGIFNPPQAGITTGPIVFSGLAAGTYTIGAQDANGCEVVYPIIITQSLLLNVIITASTQTMCIDGTCTLTVTPSGGEGVYTYTWSNTGATSVSINPSPTVTTQYTVTVTDGNGCTNNDTLSITVENCTTDLAQITNSNEQVNIYPNPNNGSFVIELNPSLPLPQGKGTLMQVYDVNGKLVLNQTINGKTSIDASVLSEGVYNISLQSNEGVVNKRLVIVR